ncbi:MAG: TIGR03364 family FAD-dependent oxidoreductase [Limnoraphis robusta]|uniref:TIGR03364 family FAD-dependent oxidoreductase n=1 Tax=Limnoraphis robusta TaxID=1118279 RepID=UPI002B1FF29F|nr:TIGR03364 family FAD-dependent oxidoreductase [Limnoraphis robusta]MEA5538056.1 TIGR03364 family FAD-dependent oxidoreductase [Limnoraphis robusta Tam1]
MTQIQSTEVAIVGAGIVGLAHALAAAKRGLKVVVFERNQQAVGASIRNFGMIWPIGQPQGLLLNRALKSREIWLEIADKAGLKTDCCGSLHTAYRQDELAVLEEFIATTNLDTVALLTPEDTIQKSSAVQTEGLLGTLWSSTEVIVDPREAIGKIPAFLSAEYGVEFRWGTVVTEINYPQFIAGGKTWKADQIFVCSGRDFETLYPHIYAESGMTKVKLQMMRTAPQPHQFKIGTSLCGGLTLTHYAAFSHCHSLTALKDRIQSETPYFPQWGIHVMVSQNSQGELTIGDSHEYGLNPDPFNKAEINQYILDYLKTFVQVPSFEIAETWNGVYAKIPGKTEFIAQAETGVTLVNALSGAGMTLSFGLAEDLFASV